MPNITGYIERDPVKRPHIYEWTSQYSNSHEINGESGVGYFIRRAQANVIFNVPPYPYDGDVFSIIDTTKDSELDAATGKIIINNDYAGAHNDEAKIIYNGTLYRPGSTFALDYLKHYQQFFLYVKSINTWIGSYIRIDATIIETVVQQTYGIIFYGVCITQSGNSRKYVEVNNDFVLGVGANIRIVFTHENTVDNPTINVNDSGDIPIKYTQQDVCPPGLWKAGQAVDMVYDGLQWLVVDVGGSGGGTGSSSGGLSISQVNQLIASYLQSHNITGADEGLIRDTVLDYLRQNGVQAGISSAECVTIIENYLDTHNINASIDEAQVNRLIAEYIYSHGIGSGGGTGGGSGAGPGIPFCLCDSAADATAKIVTLANSTDAFIFRKGASVRVKFTNGNDVNHPTLNVNYEGAFPITSVGSTKVGPNQWAAGEVIDFVFDGDFWVIVDGGTKAAIDDAIANNAQLSQLIDEAVASAIQTNVSALIDEKTAETITNIQTWVQGEIQGFNDDLDAAITALNEDITLKTTTLQGQIDAARLELTNNIQTAIDNLGLTIDTKIENSFRATIDAKIQQAFDETIQGKIDEASETLMATMTSEFQTINGRITATEQNLTSTVETAVSDLQHQIDLAVSSMESDITTIINNTFANTIDDKIDAAFSATIDQKIHAAFTEAEGALNQAIQNQYGIITQRITEIENSVNTRVENIETFVENSIQDFETNIHTIIDNDFTSLIDTKINTAFDTLVDHKIQTQYGAIIETALEDAKQELQNTYSDDLDAIRVEFQVGLKQLSDEMDSRILETFNNRISASLNQLKSELQAEIQTKVNQLDASIEEKINTKFDSTIDTLMENKFSAMIDTKIEQNFNATIDTKMGQVKAEIENGLNAKIDARIRIAIDGEITTLINTKLEEYVAPAIGATY